MSDFFSQMNSEDAEHPSGEVLMLYVDGELPPRDVSQLQSHLEVCWYCRVRTKKIEQSIAEIVEFDHEVLRSALNPPNGFGDFGRRLNQVVNESGKRSKFAGAMSMLRALSLALQRFRWSSDFGISPTHLFRGGVGPLAPPVRRASWLRGSAVAVGAVVFVVLLVWLHVSNQPVVHAGDLVVRADQRQRAWTDQPGKVLHWIVELDVQNSATLPDGHYRTLYWQNNQAGRAGYIIRRYDASGMLVFAYWRKSDGSDVSWRRFAGDRIQITPSSVELRNSLSGLQPELAEALEAFLKNRESQFDLKLRSQSVNAWFNQARERNQVLEVTSPEHGPSYRVTTEKSFLNPVDGVARLVMEEDIAKSSFRRYQLKSTRYKTDGSTATEYARWTYFGESSAQDFDANDLRNELAGSANIERLSAEDVAREWLKREKKLRGN